MKITKDKITPIKKIESDVVVVFQIDDNYSPYMAATIASIMENGSPLCKYDLIVLDNGVSEQNKPYIDEMLIRYQNVSIRYYDITELVCGLYTVDRFSTSVYGKLLIPYIFKIYDKVLFLDCDLIVLSDIKELYDMDIGDTYLAAHKDDYALLNPVIWNEEYKKKYLHLFNYFEHRLNLTKSEIEKYFNTGVLVMNIEKLNKSKELDLALNLINEEYLMPDQDILNIAFKGNKHKELPIEWNINNRFYNENEKHLIKYLPEPKDMKIIHYSNNVKPWKSLHVPFSYLFWRYAKKTPYYELLYVKCIQPLINEITIKDVLRPFIKRLLPTGTHRRRIMGKIYNKLRKK